MRGDAEMRRESVKKEMISCWEETGKEEVEDEELEMKDG